MLAPLERRPGVGSPVLIERLRVLFPKSPLRARTALAALAALVLIAVMPAPVRSAAQAPTQTAVQSDPAQIDSLEAVIDSVLAEPPEPAARSAQDTANVDPDGDGVPVLADFCPATPPGARVGEDGCQVPDWPLYASGLGLIALILMTLHMRRRGRLKRARRLQRRRMVREAMQYAGSNATTFRFDALPTADEAPEPEPPPVEPQPSINGALRPGPATPMPSRRTYAPAASTGGGPGPAVATPPVSAPAPATPAPAAASTADVFFAGSSANMSGNPGWNDQPLVFQGTSEKEPSPRSRVSPVVLFVAVALMGGAVVAWAAVTSGEAAPGPGAAEEAQSVVVAIAPPEGATAEDASIPARLILFGGDQQEGRRGRQLVQPISVRVENAAGDPVPDIPVLFTQTVGEGAVEPDTVATDDQGVASAAWTLGPRFPRQFVLAHVQGFEDGPGVAFEASAVSGAPTDLTVIAGEGQEGTPGQPLPQPVVFLVVDEDGLPVEGVPIALELPEGQGAVTPVEAVSGPDGTVRAMWTLADAGGELELTAHLIDDDSVRVVAAARADLPVIGTRAGVVTGGVHSCALAPGGDVRCWGGNASGQLGRQGVGVTTPRPLASGVTFAELSAGLSHTCGVGGNGSLMCWGDNADGQLGDGTRTGRTGPRPVDSQVRFRSVSAGPRHTCGLGRNGRALCWGSNANGELGDRTTTPRTSPVAVVNAPPLQSISAGWTHTCGVGTDGFAYCWGRNAFGQLGDGGNSDRTTPIRVAASAGFRRVAAGSAHTCGVGTDGRGYCWGQNAYGQLGNGGDAQASVPTGIGGGPWQTIVVGGVHSCGLDDAGRAFCWGRNTYGQLGDGSNIDRNTPTPVAGGLRFRGLHASGAHTCGTSTDGSTYCWGYNVEGQLGNGTRVNQNSPARVSG